MQKKLTLLALTLGVSVPVLLFALGIARPTTVEAAGNPFGPNNGQNGWIANVLKTRDGAGGITINIPDFNTETGFNNGTMPIGDGLRLDVRQETSPLFANGSRTKIFGVDVVNSNDEKIGDGYCQIDVDNGRLAGTANDQQGECHATGRIDRKG